ncbi:MAG: glutathione transferase GstA [Gammaproteobacteria bacterium]
MKLYSHPGTCSSASHIALHEAGLEFELVKLNLRSDRKLPDGRNLADVNPKGYVPVLELDNGELLTENIAVLQYIADQNPESGLAPANGTMERYRLQEWLGYINSEVHKRCSLMFMPDIPDQVKEMMKEQLGVRLTYIDGKLADRDCLMGDQFTVADAYLFIVLSWAPMLAIDLSPYVNIGKYQARIAERDSVKSAKAAAES